MPCHSDFNQTCGGSEFGNTITSQYAHMMRLPHNSIMRTMTSLNAAGKREAKPTSEDNQPVRFELFLLGDGEKKVTEEADTREFSGFLQHGEFPHQAAMRSIDSHRCIHQSLDLWRVIPHETFLMPLH